MVIYGYVWLCLVMYGTVYVTVLRLSNDKDIYVKRRNYGVMKAEARIENYSLLRQRVQFPTQFNDA